MSTLTFPTAVIAAVTWRLTSNTQTFTSPLSGLTQTVELPGAKWGADIQFKNMTNAEKKQVSAFLVKLRGRAGQFYLSEPRNTISGSGSGTPTVDTAISNTPTTVGSTGWTASATGVLLAGDLISWGTDELKMVVEDVNADISGNASITVEPPCRNQPITGTSINMDSPVCIMRLSDDEQAAWSAMSSSPYTMSIKCEEAIV